MDGCEMMYRIKTVKKYIPVILMSTYITKETADELKEEGAYEHFWKPYNMDRVLKTVDDCMR